MHVVVTGGAGYVGSTLVPRLLQAGCRVTVIDRFYFGGEPLGAAAVDYGDRLRLLKRDVRRTTRDDLRGADALVDLAGIANDPSCELDPELTRAVNLDACVHLAGEAIAAGVERIVFASSCSVYGHGRSLLLNESMEPQPVSLYARCKADAERRLFELGGKTGATVTALRFATVFGVSGRTRFDVAVNVMTKNAYVAGRILVDGGGRQWRPFVHVRDVAEAVRRVLDAPEKLVGGKVFNVGSEKNNLRIIQLAYRIREHVPRTEIVLAPTDPDPRDYHVSFERLRSDLDFEPALSVDDGIREVLEALRSGAIDPDDRRSYTLRQYAFLADVERTFRDVAIDGHVLA